MQGDSFKFFSLLDLATRMHLSIATVLYIYIFFFTMHADARRGLFKFIFPFVRPGNPNVLYRRSNIDVQHERRCREVVYVFF